VLTLTPKQKVAWKDHLKRPELRRHLFYGGAWSGKIDVILAWLCVQAAKYPGARALQRPGTLKEHRIIWRPRLFWIQPCNSPSHVLAGFRWRFWIRLAIFRIVLNVHEMEIQSWRAAVGSQRRRSCLENDERFLVAVVI